MKSLTDLIREGINLATANPIDERCAIAEQVAAHVRKGLSQEEARRYAARKKRPRTLNWFARDILAKKAESAAKAPGACL